jgi:SSS family solute:Na+ symporter
MALGISAAYLVYLTPDGLYKYLQTISIYLVMPVTPAIVFGIMSRRVTLAGAIASVLVGMVLATLFVTDQLIGVEAGRKFFPWLHHTLTLNYTYRGLWGTLCIIATLFLVSAITSKTAPAKLEATTMKWEGRIEPFEGLSDWRLQLGLLGCVTVIAYAFLW